MILDRGAIEFLTQTFASLARLCQKAERQQIPVQEIRKELTVRWRNLRGILEGGLKQ